MSAHRRHFARNTLIVGVSLAFAALTGLLRNMVIARYSGIGADLDAYYAAFKLPDLLFTVLVCVLSSGVDWLVLACEPIHVVCW